MNEPPRSELYDDVYFSPDGWAEKRQVFVEGAKLEERWRGRPRFVVGELGFGCGLSMLATWHAAQTHPGFVQFVSVEGHPLGRDQIQEGLSAFPELQPLVERFLRQYPERPPGPGVHHFDLSERFALTLFVGDVNDVLQDVDGAVDAWFLDGFAPAKNPAMWSASVLARVAALSARGATLGSYTASGEVRRILEASGFHIERVEGFGNKRHRIVGAYVGTPRRVASPRSVAIVGAGIAGASLARSLRRRGVSVT
ncbi:MAG: tRNA (5-methylaminomethyl-2-thiouridine)(34)-methyltransferase MnmD, partial [Myxococcota bacterium]